jgi:hypothetical protein
MMKLQFVKKKLVLMKKKHLSMGNFFKAISVCD